MTQRGRILRETNSGPGLLVSEGQQYQFALEGMWRSEVAPVTGMIVDVTFDPQGRPAAIYAVPDNQLVREQADKALAGAKTQGAALAGKAVNRFGIGTLLAMGGLVVGWFLLTTLSLGPRGEGLDLTFWQLLGFANETHAIGSLTSRGPGILPGTGFYGLLAILALAGPLLRFFWSARRATLGGLLPMLYMILVFCILRSNLLAGARLVTGLAGEQADQRLMKMFLENLRPTLGLGSYISIVCGLYFSWVALKKFLAAGTRSPQQAAYAIVTICMAAGMAVPARAQALNAQWITGDSAEALWSKLEGSPYAQDGDKGLVIYLLTYSSCPNCISFLNSFYLPHRNQIELREIFAPIDNPRFLNESADVAMTRDARAADGYYRHTRVAPSFNGSPDRIAALKRVEDLFGDINSTFSRIDHIQGGYPTFIYWVNTGTARRLYIVSGFGVDFARDLERQLK